MLKNLLVRANILCDACIDIYLLLVVDKITLMMLKTYCHKFFFLNSKVPNFKFTEFICGV